ncbi:MAG TPA: PIN domain-containing protein [Thermoanaerobaculia bacterium]|nr:PIN domain-containing protein [Thermoanaerobaculia bacterium]
MLERAFVDSNVLIYAHDPEAGDKQRIAARLLQELWSSRNGVLSIQVLQEFYNTITRKVRPAARREIARELIRVYSSWTIQAVAADDVVSASLIEERYNLSFWDALIVQAAHAAGARLLLSEDFSHGQSIAGVRIENPFAR